MLNAEELMEVVVDMVIVYRMETSGEQSSLPLDGAVGYIINLFTHH